MTPDSWRWRDAERMAQWLVARQTESEILTLVARLPFLNAETIGPLIGLKAGGHLYRCLVRLGTRHLIDTIRPVLQPGRNPDLFYLTDLGLTTLAVLRQVDPIELATHNRLRRCDLLERVTWLPLLVACYELLALLAPSQSEAPRLRTWECPWRRRFQPATRKAPVSITVPAGVTLAGSDDVRAYLLLPDLGNCSVRAFRATLDRLVVLRGQQRARFSTLVVATLDRSRAAIWHDVLEEVREARHEAPIAARVATWPELRAEGESSRTRRTWLRFAAAQEPAGPQPSGRSAHRTVPRLVGTLMTGVRSPNGIRSALGQVALDLTPRDRALLDLLARHPFLSTDDLATALGCDAASVQRRQDRLGAAGILRVLTAEETGYEAAEMVELTRSGLVLVAHWQGLSLGTAVRWNGLAGGGPQRPIGTRGKLLQDLAHTRGADALFLGLLRTARELACAGRDDALIEWRNASACSRGYLRPDGYGLYRHGGQLYGFFLEYDRGTMSLRGYLKKFATYYDYWASGRSARDYAGFPTILVVTTTYAAEVRIAAAARLAAVARARTLPVLLTSAARIQSDPLGLLGPIWCAPLAPADDRRGWLLDHDPGRAASVRLIPHSTRFPQGDAGWRANAPEGGANDSP